MSAEYERARVLLESPALFIGGPVQELLPADYALDAASASPRSLRHLDVTAVASLLVERNGARGLDGLRAVLDRRTAMLPFLEREIGGDWLTATDRRSRAIAFASSCVLVEPTGPIRPIVRDAAGRFYLPGSSLKGALRTALLFAVRRSDATKLGGEVLAAMDRLRRGSAQFFSRNQLQLEQPLQQGFRDRGNVQGTGPTADVLRTLVVRDSLPSHASTNVTRLSVANITTAGVAEKTGAIIEVALDVRAEVELVFDRTLAKTYAGEKPAAIDGIEELLAEARGFAAEQWVLDRQYWLSAPRARAAAVMTRDEWGRNLGELAVQRFGRPKTIEQLNQFRDAVRPEMIRLHGPEPGSAPSSGAANTTYADVLAFYGGHDCPYGLRIGAGSGMFGTSLAALLDESTRVEIRNRAGVPSALNVAPKTRKVVRTEGGFQPLGWCSVKVLEREVVSTRDAFLKPTAR